MKYIITENQRDRLMVKRRLRELKDLIRHQFPYYYPCDYDSLEQYMMAMKVEMFQVTILDWFDKVDNDVIWDMVTDLYGDLMIENYTTRCRHKMR
jgi:hypothetical protein